MATDAGISDNAIIDSTRHHGSDQSGWASLGNAIGGGGVVAGNNAYDSGMRVGAQTADALAQAKDRVQKSTAAEQAATALRDPALQTQLGITPELGNYYATQAEQGGDPEKITKSMLDVVQMKNKKTIADPTQSLESRHAAAYSEAPASMAPKAEGPLGSVFDPGANAGSGQTTVSPLQQQVAQAGAGLKTAQTGVVQQNADAHTTTANAAAANAAGGPKLKTGYQWAVDSDKTSPTYGQVKNGPDGTPLQVPNPSAGGGHEGVLNARYNQNMLGAASGMARELQNVAAIGPTTSAGATGFAPGHTGIVATLSDNLGRSLSSTDQQEFHKSMQNMGRFVGILENGGRATTKGASGSAQEAIESQAADTQNSRLYGLAIARQVMEAQQDRIHASGTTPAVIDTYDKELETAKKAIPFTPLDVINFGKTGKGVAFADWLKKNGQDAQAAAPQGGAAPTAGGLPPGFRPVN